MLKLDMVCPIYNPGDALDNLLNEIADQENIEIGQVIFPITCIDTENDKKTIAKIKNRGYSFFLTDKINFSHSLTRERAIRDFCENDVVIIINQDIRLTDNNTLFKLASAVSPEIPYAYGRQICHGKGIEDYTRKMHYPPQNAVVSKEDLPKLGLMAFFSSDAFAAYYRPVFLELNGYDGKHMMMNEDMYFVYKVLMAGLSKAYVADAIVEHGHIYTLKQLFERYREAGLWFKDNSQFAVYNTNGSGIQMALFILKSCWKDKNWPVLCRFIPDMIARWLGIQIGKRCCK